MRWIAERFPLLALTGIITASILYVTIKMWPF